MDVRTGPNDHTERRQSHPTGQTGVNDGKHVRETERTAANVCGLKETHALGFKHTCNTSAVCITSFTCNFIYKRSKAKSALEVSCNI